MTRIERPLYLTQYRPLSPAVARTIPKFSESRRNVIRGAVAEARRGSIGSDKVNVFRMNDTESDMVAAATILDSPGALRSRSVTGLVQSDIAMVHNIEVTSSTLEAAYACGFINSWKEQSISAINTIAALSYITHVTPREAVAALRAAVQEWGASNYIAHKICFVKEFIRLDESDRSAIDEIDATLGHKACPSIQYSILEIIKPRISLFSVARRHVNTLLHLVDGDFRRLHSLNNLVATPICNVDCGGFILRSVETSLIDAILALFVIINLRDRFPAVINTIENHLDREILNHLYIQQKSIALTSLPNLFAEDSLDNERGVEDRSLSLYRRCAVFLEHPQFCAFRNDLDRVIGHRLIAPLVPSSMGWHAEGIGSHASIKRPNEKFDISLHGSGDVKVDTFYRTYLFLRFLQDLRNVSSLNRDDFQYILDNTMALESLLLESELKTMHLNASDEARALISVLALALYRSKSSDPDIDFDFRAQLEQFILSNFDGNILSFIDYLAPKSPEIANYIASSLDEVTLQKMYSIVASPLAAETARRDILTSVGVHLNKIEYIIEAESIETRSKVAKLKNYFDASRMFVDSVAMKKWLSSNPSAYIQEYREILPKLVGLLSESNLIEANGQSTKIGILALAPVDAYLVEQMASDAFREFCVNNEFGIESYLGRRIRHNTLHGVMTKCIDAVLQRPEYHPIIAGTPFGSAIRGWESGYKIFIERMRREFLQFRSDSKPNALFNSEMDLSDQNTSRNVHQLVHTLRVSGAEMLDELIISFCWRQIAPQLESASRQIRVKMARDMTQSLAQTLQRFNGPEEQKIKAALADGISSAFAEVASWFHIPQTGYVPASISEICKIIDMDFGWSASLRIIEDAPTKYYGISVHRLYDCLAVLLQNAFKHAKRDSDVTVYVSSTPISGTNLRALDVCVLSVLPEKDAGNCISRVEAAVTSSETGRDMVTEGYSGIKKVKFITKINEGASTVYYKVTGGEIEIGFRLKAEVASEEIYDEENSPC